MKKLLESNYNGRPNAFPVDKIASIIESDSHPGQTIICIVGEEEPYFVDEDYGVILARLSQCLSEDRAKTTRATTLMRGCVVKMKPSSGLQGWGNPQCIENYNEHLGEVSLFGHNQNYKDHEIAKVLEYPIVVES